MTTKAKSGFRLNLPAKATVIYTLTGALERGMTFLFTPIFTRTLTPEQYGLYPLYISWLGVLSTIVTLDLSGNVIYRGLTKYKSRANEFLSSALGLMSVSVVLFLLTLGVFGGGLSRLLGLSPTVLFFLLIQIFINGILNLYFARCKFFYKYLSPSVINVLVAILSPLTALLIIRLSAYDSEARIIAPLLIGGVIVIPLVIIFLKSSRRVFSREIWGYLIRFVAPLLPHFLASCIIAQSGKLAIGRYFGEGALAKYSLVFSLGFIFTVVTSGINSGLSPWINRKLSAGMYERVDELSVSLFSLFAPLTLMSTAFVPEGLSFLAPIEYRDALIAVYPLSISVLLGFLCTTLYTVVLYYGKGRLVTLGTVATAVLTLILHMALTKRYGYFGAGLVQCISSLILAIISMLILGGVLKKHTFKVGRFLPAFLLAVFFALLLFLLRDSFLARVLVFLALAVLLIPRAIRCYKMIKE